MYEFHAEKGCSLGRFVDDLLKVSQVIEVCGVFNDVNFYVKPGDTKESIIDSYWEYQNKKAVKQNGVPNRLKYY
jgi:hypothetical protein